MWRRITSISKKHVAEGHYIFLWCHYSRGFKIPTTCREKENGDCQLSNSGSREIQTIVGGFFPHLPCNYIRLTTEVPRGLCQFSVQTEWQRNSQSSAGSWSKKSAPWSKREANFRVCYALCRSQLSCALPKKHFHFQFQVWTKETAP